MINIVLYQPQIPQNTGNIARTCSVTGAVLHLIKPYGFLLNEKNLKRAGLDYWNELNVKEYQDLDEFFAKNPDATIYLVTKFASRYHTEFQYGDSDYFIFGNETSGLPKELHHRYNESRVRIPMLPKEHARCLNLSNSVAIILYEALRQTGFQDLM